MYLQALAIVIFILHIDSSTGVGASSYLSAIIVHGTYFGYLIVTIGIVIGLVTGTKMESLPKVVSVNF